MFRTRLRLASVAALLVIVIVHSGCGNNSLPNNSGSVQPASPGASTAQSVSHILNVPIAIQQKPDWCWLASGQMLFQYFSIPAVNPLSYQCGIIAVFAGPFSTCFASCDLCPFSAGSSQNVSIMLQGYVSYATNQTRALVFQFVPGYLSPQTLQSELDAGRPILAGINTNGFAVFGSSQHLVVIVGYHKTGQIIDGIVVNDPFPYAIAGNGDPYLSNGARMLQTGQYQIDAAVFVQHLAWNTTWYDFVLE